MRIICNIYRHLCTKPDITKLKRISKVPSQPHESKEFNVNIEDIKLDTKTIQLLERLSLINLGDKEALETIQNSIAFALKISQINTDNVKPLYCVLEDYNLQLRKDKITEGNCREEILQNAKVTDEDYFISPPGNIPLELEEKDFK